MTTRLVTTTIAFVSLGFLAGCGGGGGGSTASVTLPPVFADGVTPIDGSDFASFIGQSFPVKIAFGTSDGLDAAVGTVTGNITVIDADTIEVTLNSSAISDTDTVTLTRVAGTDDFEDSDGFRIDFDDLDAYQFFAVFDDPFDETDLFGGFGFQTPESQYPNSTLTYNSDTASAVYITVAGSDEFTFLGGGTVDVDVNFDTNAVTGTVFDGDTLIDIDDDLSDDDRLAVALDIDGTLSGAGITGTISGSASVDVDDNATDVTDLNLNISSSSVDAALFGNDPDVVAGVYEGNFTFTDPTDGPTSGNLSGYFDASQSP